MRYVILRDDDTNALTPIDCLERLYRPFLDRGLPVNLATIPNVSTQASYAAGHPELFLMAKKGDAPPTLPIGGNRELVRYLQSNRHYHMVQHGCRHEFVNGRHEFDHRDQAGIVERLDEGARLMTEAGFPRPSTFVAPYDRLSRTALREAARRYRIVSGAWYEVARVPIQWWPRYALKKLRRASHWRADNTFLLTHPGCHLSFHRPYDTMLDEIIRSIHSRKLTVLVTHWWEYFRDKQPDDAFIGVLHCTAQYLSGAKDIQVISFDDIVEGRIEPGPL